MLATIDILQLKNLAAGLEDVELTEIEALKAIVNLKHMIEKAIDKNKIFIMQDVFEYYFSMISQLDFSQYNSETNQKYMELAEIYDKAYSTK